MTSPRRTGFILGLVLTSVAIFFSSCAKPAKVKEEEIEGSALLKQFDARQDIKSSPATKEDFIARLGPPKSSEIKDGVETVTWYYRRYNHEDELGEFVSYEARFDLAGVYKGADSKHSGTLNLAAYLKKHLTPQELGTAPPTLPVVRPADTAATATVTPFDYQRVSFEEFFGAELASVPLSFEIPKAYVRAVGFTSSTPSWMAAPALLTVWMRSTDVAASVASHHLPEAGGFMHGQQAPPVVDGFDPYSGKFHHEDQLESFLSQRRMTLLAQKRLQVKGHPILAYLARNPEGIIVGSLSVATARESAVLAIAYRPAATDNLATVRATWDHILTSLQ